jgi:hypothetical protein
MWPPTRPRRPRKPTGKTSRPPYGKQRLAHLVGVTRQTDANANALLQGRPVEISGEYAVLTQPIANLARVSFKDVAEDEVRLRRNGLYEWNRLQDVEESLPFGYNRPHALHQDLGVLKRRQRPDFGGDVHVVRLLDAEQALR